MTLMKTVLLVNIKYSGGFLLYTTNVTLDFSYRNKQLISFLKLDFILRKHRTGYMYEVVSKFSGLSR